MAQQIPTEKLKSPFTKRPILPSSTNAKKIIAAFFKTDIARDFPEWVPVIEYWRKQLKGGYPIVGDWRYKDHEFPDDYKIYMDCKGVKIWHKHTGPPCAGWYNYYVKGDDMDAVTEAIKSIHRVYPAGGYGTRFKPVENPDGDEVIYLGYRTGSCD